MNGIKTRCFGLDPVNSAEFFQKSTGLFYIMFEVKGSVFTPEPAGLISDLTSSLKGEKLN
jgi:hypothetical protein